VENRVNRDFFGILRRTFDDDMGFVRTFSCIPVLCCLLGSSVGFAEQEMPSESLPLESFSRIFNGASSGVEFNFSALPLSVFHVLGANERIQKATKLRDYCQKIDVKYAEYGWGKSPCDELPWTFTRQTETGQPLIYWEYSDSNHTNIANNHSETTLILGGVHPDEITPIHLAFEFAKALSQDPALYSGVRVIVAPLVNPDGFFKKKPTRTNFNKIDLNRNFPTKDWYTAARKAWRARKKSDPRHNPGFAPHTEEGTRFQVDLLHAFEPDKVLSVHSPLGFLDYDGPGDEKLTNLSEHEKRAREIASVVSKNSSNYRIVDYGFYPGSLGNYSGNERSIPTITVELDSTNPKLVQKYWKEFFPGLRAAIKYEFRKSVLAELTSRENRKAKNQEKATNTP
jgi:protein MpaA